jgi:hypothetical protein
VATREEGEKLRGLLGERKPPGGSESDTLFTDQQILDLIDEAGGDVEKAAFAGWRYKQAEFANLVNVTEGNSRRDMSDLLDNANSMVKLYGNAMGGNTEGRTRIGRIVRST